MLEGFRVCLLSAVLGSVLVGCGGGGRGTVVGGSGGGGETPAPPAEVAQHNVACAALPAALRTSFTDLKLVSATEVAATSALPAYCDVRGTIKNNVKFAVYLPKDWNGRFQMVGNGGKAGSISFPAMVSAIQEGYATSSTDTGHDTTITAQSGARFGYDAEFGDEMEIDFAYRAVNLTARASKEIINAHYPKTIEYSYWNGCSTGGRQGLMEAQRFPEDFDGYVIGAPVNNYTRQQLSAPATLQHLYKNGIRGGNVLSQTKRDLVGNIIYNGNGTNYPGCDAMDGLKDGQIRNPLACNFHPEIHVPACGATDEPTCLTTAELTALQGVYAGHPTNSVHPLPVGSENIASGWSSWLVPDSPTGTPSLHTVMVDAFQYLMFQPDRPTFDYLTQLDWNSDPYQMEKAKQLYNATNPDLRAFAAAGKKIVMYHGWADAGVNPLGTIEYKNNVNSLFGGDTAVNSFMKLYMIPGMGHCSGGPGHNNVDWMGHVSNWVEKGQAPTSVIGTKIVGGVTSRRPHCPYPSEAVYNGTGDVNAAASFTCRTL
ncbi:tannase/feruloyl esterase family alpha/beta hydrolase [Variovorax beijingensis]|uniref:Tannase/feruloyl esterase family alpha/beta hydrolase n=1 Tax=Variovorax beijingensis TaxID=2496117 RepID=A0A3P3EWR0_9BURK|nr:tannase/feruloyl esterase family alpha/beta hydrolase [Variovorax beijingensis]RRH90312.1 tannase/feruloyl esterase family alpha/beta hydrolase [Variovorax beijingensis]